MKRFECKKCKKIFEAEGEEVSDTHAVFGRVKYWQASHDCGEICREYVPPSDKKHKHTPACAGNCPTCPYQ